MSSESAAHGPMMTTTHRGPSAAEAARATVSASRTTGAAAVMSSRTWHMSFLRFLFLLLLQKKFEKEMNNTPIFSEFTVSLHLFPVNEMLHPRIQLPNQFPGLRRIYLHLSCLLQGYPVEFQIKIPSL